MSTPALTYLRRWGLNLLLVLGASLISFGLGELLVRLVAPQQLIVQRPDLYRPMDTVGYAHRPNVLTTVNSGDRTVTMHTDSSGFRVGAKGRPTGEYRVLLLGDSFVAAMQVEYEESLPGLIEQCFATRTGHTAAVWNAGVAGWDPPQYYVQARHTLPTARFDLVLVAVYLGNDVVNRRYVFPPREADRERTFWLPRKLSYREFVDAFLAPINDLLETRSHLFVFLKNRFQTLLMRAGLTAVEVSSSLKRSEAQSPRWSLTAGILADIDSLAKAYGTPTLFALIPAVEQVEPNVLRERLKGFGIDPASLDLDQPSQLLGIELERRKLSYVSLLRPLREAQARGVSLYGVVDKHPSADGHRVMWDALAPALAAKLRLDYRPNGSTYPPCTSP